MPENSEEVGKRGSVGRECDVPEWRGEISISPIELGLRDKLEIFFAVIALAFDGSERSADEAFDGAVDGRSEVAAAARDLARV